MDYIADVQGLKDLLKKPLLSKPMGILADADIQIQDEKVIYIFEGNQFEIFNKMQIAAKFFKEQNIETSKIGINANPQSGAMEIQLDYNESSKAFHDYMWDLHYLTEWAFALEPNSRENCNKALTSGKTKVGTHEKDYDERVTQTLKRFGIKGTVTKTDEFEETKDKRTQAPSVKRYHIFTIADEENSNKFLDLGNVCLQMARGTGPRI